MPTKTGAGGQPQEYDKSTGQFGNGSGRKTREEKEFELEAVARKWEGRSPLPNGAKSGALDSDDKDRDRADKHAERYYAEVMKRRADVPRIARLLGKTEEEIEAVKQYVFGNDEFEPDYDQAQTWQRLTDGKPLELDRVFIEHELLEMRIRKENPQLTYREAHEQTNQKFNYQEMVEDMKRGTAKKERNK